MRIGLFCFALVLSSGLSDGRTILVNTTNNISTGPNETNFVRAINLLNDGDTIQFAIPGTGPFYVVTPPRDPDNGFPPITKNNVTIDGYSQPGAVANTNTILGSNTAQIQIVLDSRAGGLHVEDVPGYGTGEGSVLMIKGATNVTIRGLCFLGPGIGSGDSSDPASYGVSFANGSSSGHVNGCWFGVAPDRTNVFRLQDAITAFEGPSGVFSDGIEFGVEKAAPTDYEARAQFNVIVGGYIPIILEGASQRIAGNFINVFPDGVTDYNMDGSFDHEIQAAIEIGRSGDNLVIGTDGDGINDAEERNVFGGVTFADDGTLLEWYGCSGHNMVIAGNYIGMAVDGVTRFTNSVKLFDQFNSSANVRIGTDGDGISDDLEANVIAMNDPFDTLFSVPTAATPPDFGKYEAGARVCLRGNRMIGNNLAPFSYADGFGTRLNDFTNFYAPFLDTAQIIPTLDTNSTQARLRGTCATGLAPCTNVLIDVYSADVEGWTNGQKFEFSELAYTDPLTSETKYHGFAQGEKWLAQFADNGPLDADPAPGQFDFDITALNLSADELITVAASYSASPIGTHNAESHTSPFAVPILLQPAPRLTLTSAGENVLLSWPTNAGLFTIQSTPSLSPCTWTDLNPQPTLLTVGANFQAALPATNTATFFRLIR